MLNLNKIICFKGNFLDNLFFFSIGFNFFLRDYLGIFPKCHTSALPCQDGQKRTLNRLQENCALLFSRHREGTDALSYILELGGSVS